tara:strand:+ start:175 stop:396 length:222 start_codon:yes stop_codon:yes gene_type:complete
MIYIINIKSVYGNYSVFEKEFTDDRHQSNWYRFMVKKGHKIIGITPKHTGAHRKEQQLMHQHRKDKRNRKALI